MPVWKGHKSDEQDGVLLTEQLKNLVMQVFQQERVKMYVLPEKKINPSTGRCIIDREKTTKTKKIL